MAKQLSDIIGSWAPLLKEEFKKDYMKELSKDIDYRRKNLFESFEPRKGDLFEIFKKTPMEKVKALYVVDTPEFDPYLYLDIEKEVTSGLDFDMSAQEDYQWLLDQGIMIFPRSLSWGEDGPHKQWRVFTDEVILKLTENKQIMVVTNDYDLITMLDMLRNFNATTASKLETPWLKIDKYIKQIYNEEIKWSPASQVESR